MTPARWAQMKEIFSAAQEKPVSEREAFLNDVCADASLREEVRKLLEAEDRPALESPVAGMLAAPARPAVIGRYRIIRLLGEGGMGAVYEAEQDQPRRTVALKVIRSGLASRELLRRFEHEAQALGRLHHPGIAQIYEAGTADTGFGPQPYFAMEFIQGASLLRYAEAHELGTRARLELMARICEAVHHAHQRGIIHRDLKPGNILVDETGQPKVVDFGVARATDADAQATRQTDLGQLVGTLAYMSPEQVLGDPLALDTRSDVYALGVLLFELLAGRMPYQIGSQLPKAVQTIREEDPARLSTISRAYRGDIETIVAKALEKDKARRYQSAAELAADIQRYLQDEPIVARRSTTTYHLRKFARRHRALVIGVAAVFLTLVGGVIVSTWEAARAWRAGQEALRQRDSAAAAQQASQKERDRALNAERTATNAERTATEERNRAVAEKQHADTESATAKAISDFLQNDLLAQASAWSQARPDNKPDPDLKVRTALDRAAARIAGRFDRQPLVEAAIRQTIGQAYKDLGVYPEAQHQLDRALGLRSHALGEQHPLTLETMYSLAMLYRSQGKYGEAEQLVTKVLEARRRTRGEWNVGTVEALSALAALDRLQGKYPQSESMYSKVLEMRRRILGRGHPDTLNAMNDLAVLYFSEGKFAAAESLLTHLLDLRQRANGEEHPDTLISKGNLADVYRKEGKYALSEPLFVQVLETRRRVLGEEHPLTLTTEEALAALYLAQGKYPQSASMFSKVLEARRRTLGGNHPATLITMNDLAVLHVAEGKYAEAELLLTEVVDIRRRLNGEEHPDTLNGMYNLADLYRREGKYTLAEPLILQVMERRRRAYGEEHPGTLNAMYMLGMLYGQEGRDAEAEPLEIKALAGRRRVLGEEHPSTLSSMAALAALYQEEGKSSAAEPLLTNALETSRRVLGPAHATTRLCAVSLAKLRLEQQKYAEAETLLRGSLNAKDNEGPYSWQPFEHRSLLGLSLMEQSKLAEAEPLLLAGYRGLLERKSVLPVAVSVEQAGERVVQLYTRWGKADQAAQWRQEVQAAALGTPGSK